MKILLVHNFYRSGAPGGEDVVFAQEKSLLEAAGHEVITYTRSNDEMNERNPLDVLRTIAGLRRSRRTVRELGALLQRDRPDVAHFHNTFPLISASGYEACVEAGVPVVQTLHNFRMTCAAGTHYRAGRVCESCTAQDHRAAIEHRCYRNSAAASFAVARMLRAQAIDRSLVRGVDRFLVLSPFAAKRFVAAGIPPEKITVKPNCVEVGEQLVERPHRDVTAARPFAIFVGRLSSEKGVRTLLRAWQGLRDLPLKIVGDGPLRGELQAIVHEANLPVEFLGLCSRADTLAQVAQAAMQIVPSECFEGTPLVIPEAWSRGTPVIAAHLGSMIDTLGPEPCGIFFTPGDAADLMRAVRQLQADPLLGAALRTKGFDRCRRVHSPAATLAVLESTYQSLLASRVAA